MGFGELDCLRELVLVGLFWTPNQAAAAFSKPLLHTVDVTNVERRIWPF
jgi:hypothetical protein